MRPNGSSPCSQQPAFVMILNQINAVNAFEVVPFVKVSPPKPHTCHMSRPSNRPCFGHLAIWRKVQIMKLFIMQFSPSSCNFLLSGPKYFGSTLFWNALSPVPPLTRQIKSHTHTRRPAKLQFLTF